jgi:hypothetical protein
VAPLTDFLQTDWFNLIQTISIVMGLLFTGVTLRREISSRRLSNLLALKQEHRELWNTIHERPELSRIMKADLDLLASPMTEEEEVFLRQLVVHVAVSWQLIQQGTPLDLQSFRTDVSEFFNLPLPKKAWQMVKTSQEKKFRQFLESATSPPVPSRRWFPFGVLG